MTAYGRVPARPIQMLLLLRASLAVCDPPFKNTSSASILASLLCRNLARDDIGDLTDFCWTAEANLYEKTTMQSLHDFQHHDMYGNPIGMHLFCA